MGKPEKKANRLEKKQTTMAVKKPE